jgi:hypothetical protein
MGLLKAKTEKKKSLSRTAIYLIHIPENQLKFCLQKNLLKFIFKIFYQKFCWQLKRPATTLELKISQVVYGDSATSFSANLLSFWLK